MASQWIDAATARKIVAGDDHHAALTIAAKNICRRANAGLVKARAKYQTYNKKYVSNFPVMQKFWWAGGEAAFIQNWATGDFSTWLDHKIDARVFGVEFELDGILAMLPAEQRPIVARSLSVAGNPDWLSARAARDVVAERQNLSVTAAEKQLIEMAKLGFAAARAVTMGRGKDSSDLSGMAEREWDIPVWFWERCTLPDRSHRDWIQGTFGGHENGKDPPNYVHLTGVHFLRTSIEQDSAGDLKASPLSAVDKLPPVPAAKLQSWWDGKAAIRDSLTQKELWALARNAFPDNHVARDRIRELAEDRKRGPKPSGG